MMPERIDDPPQTPAMLVADGPNRCRSRRDGPFESGIRIRDDHYHTHGTTAERLRAEVGMLRGFVSHPEFGLPHAQPGDYRSVVAIDAEQLAGSKRRLIKLDGPRSVSN